MGAPWTQSLSVHWRPVLRFYEERIGVLRSLEDQGILKAFAVGNDQIGARLLDAGHELSVSEGGLSLELFGQDVELDTGWEFAMAAVEAVKPTQIRRAQARFQYIVALERPFDQAVTEGLERLLSVPALAGASYADFALLLDMAGPDDVTGHMEFGIIRDGEAAVRLGRQIGPMQRHAGPGSRALGEPRWLGTEFPRVALFVDLTWEQMREFERFEEVRGFWAAAKERSGAEVDALYGRISVER